MTCTLIERDSTPSPPPKKKIIKVEKTQKTNFANGLILLKYLCVNITTFYSKCYCYLSPELFKIYLLDQLYL